MNHLKPLLGLLPSFLESIKGWSTEMAWAYSIGHSLGLEKSTLTQANTEDNAKILLIHPEKIFEWMGVMGATILKHNDIVTNSGRSCFQTLSSQF